MITANEINILVRHHLQESGYIHTAYIFSKEAVIENERNLPPQSLVMLLKKGLLYMQLEKSINEKAKYEVSSEDIIISIIDAIKNEEPLVYPQKEIKQVKKETKLVQENIPKETSNIDEPYKIQDNDIIFLKGHLSDVFCGCWTNDGKYFASGSSDATVIIWSFCGEKLISSSILDHATHQERKKKGITALCWNSSGTILASGCLDGTVRLWSNTGDLKFVLNQHTQDVYAVQFSPDGNYLLTGSADEKVILWNVKKGEIKQIFQYHHSRILDVDWLENDIFASCDTNSTIVICKCGETKPLYILKEHTGEVNKIEWNKTTKILASCSDDMTIRIWEPFKNKPSFALIGHTHQVYAIKWNPVDNDILASASFDKTVRIWNIATKTCIAVLNKHSSAVYSVWFSPHGKYIVSGGIDCEMNIWRISDQKLIATYQANSYIYDVKWNNQGDKIALCLFNADVVIVKTRSIKYYQE